MLNSEEKFNIIKQSIAGQIEGPAYEAIQAAEQQALQKTEEEAPQSEQQTQTQQTPVGLPPAQTIPRVYDSQGSLIEPGSTGVGLNQMAGTSPGQTIQPGEYKTGGPTDPPSNADKARKFRMMRPAQGKYFEGQKENSHSTHLAESYEADGKHYVVPSITNKKAPYANYQPQSFTEAIDAGEGIPFDTEEEAIKFAEGSWKLPKYPRPKYKTGGPKSKAPKPLTESDAKLEEEWPELLKKQRFVESGFNTNAKSGAGATGSAQIMPDTLDYAKMKGWVPETIGMKDLTGASGHSISKHIQEKYMENLFNRSWNKGTNEAKKAKALLAYNWGPENTRVKLNKLIDEGVNVWDNTDFTKYFNEESKQYKGKILDDLTTKKDPHVQRDYKKLKDLSPLLRMHGGPKVLYNNKKLKK